ncbi:T9SS type A sorting domain-containing protein [Hymenobacter sp. ASUV-10]|uniref:T9SS type A sorting domain-containing protein n=1 Tax=Hymenobacter aranciens TaxID=3063996 RepID=A0ABT9BH19_9BACT|nr:T9SS type A sorting domain-containing protein [Hymenobacter sp. ASUV-10]MDO7876999.1 T9SS type A sorting domain-containing protein [Hymenobacter sp. ASUV-10]
MQQQYSRSRFHHLLFALFFLSSALLTQTAVAQNQNPGTYNFGKITRTYNSVANSTGAVPTLIGSTDEGYYNNLPLGFTFRYAGVDYTTAAASTNGWLTLGQNLSDAAPANNLATGAVRPVLAPLWDDLEMNAGGFYYLTQGSAPNRVFVAEWNNVRWGKNSQAGLGTLSAQLRLYEGSNRIEFAYRQGTAPLNAPSASIGLAGVGAGNFVSLNGTGATPAFSTTAETTTLDTKPATGQLYSFTPSSPNSTSTSLASYTTGATSGTYGSLQPNTPLSGGTDDDGYYNGLPIGFSFQLGGLNYTTLSASTNGWLLLGQNIPNAVGQYGYVNDLDGGEGLDGGANGGLYPVLAPLWDDLTMGSGAFYYFTSGSAPNRVFTAEWYNAKWNYQASNPAISFQVRLYEGSNRIEYSYRQEAGTLTNPTASIGLSLGAGSGNFLSLNGSGTAPTSSYTAETATISTKPATGQVYAFAPTVFASSAGTFTSLAGNGSSTTATRTGTVDEGAYNSLPLGFSFQYAGSTYTTVSASTNGWLTFGQDITDYAPTNDLAATTGALRPLLAPLWDDLSMQGGNVYYQTTGTAPNRVFTVEWTNARWSKAATNSVVSFQVKLYEADSHLDYVYRRDAVAPASASGSVGLSLAPGSFLSLANTSATPTTSTSASTNNLTGRPTSGQVYTFYRLNMALTASNSTYTNGIPLSGGTSDDGYYNGLPIGFSFNYATGDHTTVSVSTNGWLTFGQNITNSTPTNNLSTGGLRPLLAPLWDDLSMAQGSVYYQTTGTAPYRVFTVEWYNALWEKGAAAPTLSFEVKLYETSNRIEFVYRPEAGTQTLASQSASIGIAGTATGAGNFLALNNTSTTATAANDAAPTTLSGRPANAQIYGFSPGTINPLPVRLVSFVGQAQGLDAELRWQTAQELNNDHFELERSRDGRAFETVARIAGAGTSAQPRAYRHLDARALLPGRPSYYRLRQVDRDGTASYSAVVTLTAGETAALQLYPNPAHSQVQLLNAAGETAQLRDLSGRLLRSFATAQPLELSGLAAGVYVVQCAGRTVKLVVE